MGYGKRLSYTYKCNWCGDNYHPLKKERDKYCSRSCGYKGRRIGSVSKVIFSLCQVCNRAFRAKSARHVTCSDECRRERTKRYQWGLSVGDSPIDCINCGDSFVRTYPENTRFCSLSCKKEREKEHKRKAKRRRKRKLRASSSKALFVDESPRQTFVRYEWQCAACGCSTPESKIGLHQSDSPEQDHISPISHGGGHTPTNLQCLCRSCNNAKSDYSIESFMINTFGDESWASWVFDYSERHSHWQGGSRACWIPSLGREA